jgi:hypothetical protein
MENVEPTREGNQSPPQDLFSLTDFQIAIDDNNRNLRLQMDRIERRNLELIAANNALIAENNALRQQLNRVRDSNFSLHRTVLQMRSEEARRNRQRRRRRRIARLRRNQPRD